MSGLYLSIALTLTGTGCGQRGPTPAGPHETGQDSGCPATTWFPDLDGDGAGSETGGVEACSAPEGHVGRSGDCDDANASVHPGAADAWYDGVDSDCAGNDDFDADGDGRQLGEADCDDTDPTVNVGANEVWYDGVDSDCDGESDHDADGDGYDSADHGGVDCDDSSRAEPVTVATWGVAAGSGARLDPLDSIQSAIERATGCVVVEPGTYSEDLDFMGRSIAVVGIEGSDVTVVEGSGEGPVVRVASFEGAGTRLEGLGITGGGGEYAYRESSVVCFGTCVYEINSWSGGGVLVEDAELELRDVRLWGNQLPPYAYTSECGARTCTNTYQISYGGGIAILGASVVLLVGVDLTGNEASDGGALYLDLDAELSVSQCLLAGNGGDFGSAVASYGHLELDNSVVVDGYATGGEPSAALWASGTSRLRYTTVLDGAADVALECDWDRGCEVRNSILQTSGETVPFEARWTEPDVRASALYAERADLEDLPCDHNLCEPCDFVDWTDDGESNDDLHVSPASACATASSSGDEVGAYGGVGGGW